MPRGSLVRLCAASLIVLALPIAGCGAAAPTAAPSSEPAPTSATSEPSPSPEPSPSRDLAAAFAERDRFFEDQQLMRDGTPLVAVTEPQKEFVSQQRAYFESQGGTWTPETEWIALALAADACETSILNFHEVTASTAQAHIATSPLIAAMVQGLEGAERTAGERNVVSIMVFGAGFLCPADGPQWQAAFDELYG